MRGPWFLYSVALPLPRWDQSKEQNNERNKEFRGRFMSPAAALPVARKYEPAPAQPPHRADGAPAGVWRAARCVSSARSPRCVSCGTAAKSEQQS
eukprot:355842-Chlamydomonas_euryale.AAC.1